jgi:hypothetical protein
MPVVLVAASSAAEAGSQLQRLFNVAQGFIRIANDPI